METIGSKLVIVYPTQIPYIDNTMRDVDLIKITAYIPSSTRERDDLRAHLYFNKKNRKLPDGMTIWKKREHGMINRCVIEYPGNRNQERMKTAHNIKDKTEIRTVPGKLQVWCPVTGTDTEYNEVNITRSVTETWLRDRRIN
jgi:hypothetical protein